MVNEPTRGGINITVVSIDMETIMICEHSERERINGAFVCKDRYRGFNGEVQIIYFIISGGYPLYPLIWKQS